MIEGPCKRCGVSFNRKDGEAARFPQPYRHECAPCIAHLLHEAVWAIAGGRRAVRAAICADPEAKDDMRDVADALGFDIDEPAPEDE